MNDFIRFIEEKLYTTNGIYFIENEIRLLFNTIRMTDNISEANMIFKKLETIQFMLAKAVFKNNLNVTPFLKDFISDFDRIDDDDMKNYLYQKIKLN